MSSIFHVLTELLFISLTEMFTQIISPFISMYGILYVCGVHTLEYEHVCALLCAHVEAKAGLWVCSSNISYLIALREGLSLSWKFAVPAVLAA